MRFCSRLGADSLSARGLGQATAPQAVRFRLIFTEDGAGGGT